MRARTITDGMAIAAACELAKAAQERGISASSILPGMDEWEVYPRVATATAMKAQEEGVARLAKSAEQVYQEARAGHSTGARCHPGADARRNHPTGSGARLTVEDVLPCL